MSGKFTGGATDLAVGVTFNDHAEVWRALSSGLALPVVEKPGAKALQGDVAIRLQLGVAGRSSAHVSRDSQRMPNATRALFSWFSAAWPGMFATHMTISFNRLASMHTDEFNRGLSYLTAIGTFQEGSLWVMDGSASANSDGRVLDLDGGQWHAFDPHLPHRTLPYSGDRAYITVYCHTTSRLIDQQAGLREEMLQLGVPCPTPAQLQPLLHGHPTPRKERMQMAAEQFARRAPEAALAPGAHRPRNYMCRSCRAFGRDEDRGQPRKYCKQNYNKCRKKWRQKQDKDEKRGVGKNLRRRPAGSR